jgi:hypothetical protein
MGFWGAKTVEIREFRRVARPHIGEDDAVLFHDRIGCHLDLFMHPRSFGFARLFHALPAAVEMPAVEGAAQAVIFQPPETQIGAAMRAGAFNQAQIVRRVAKQHQLLAQQFHRHDRALALQFIGQRGGLPVPPHHRARVRAGAGAGDGFIQFTADHGAAPFYRGT